MNTSSVTRNARATFSHWRRLFIAIFIYNQVKTVLDYTRKQLESPSPVGEGGRRGGLKTNEMSFEVLVKPDG